MPTAPAGPRPAPAAQPRPTAAVHAAREAAHLAALRRRIAELRAGR